MCPRNYSALPQSPKADELYSRFFMTHVDSGITDGMLQRVPAQEVLAYLTGQGKAPTALAKSHPVTQQALKNSAATVRDFAEAANAQELLFTNDGQWVIPPKMRATTPGYLDYLKQDLEPGVVPGTAAIVLAQNEPIPTYHKGEQIGGFETGDQHGFLSIIDRVKGAKFEAHQTFLENSDDPAMRPNIVGVNPDGRKNVAQIHADAKSPTLKLDDVGMLQGKHTPDVLYGCEITPNIDKAFNWNNGVQGANFNYIPLAAFEFKLTRQQLGVLLFDRELAGRESGIKAAPEATGKQNEPGYVPLTRPSFYPDGSERYVTVKKIEGKDGTETQFSNAHRDMPGGLPQDAIRVMEYVTNVEPQDMQVVMPYNNLGGSKHCMAGSNCFKAAADMLDGVATAGVGQNVRATLGAQNISEAGLTRMLVGNLVGGKTQVIAVSGAVGGNITLHSHVKDGSEYTFYDFAGMARTAALSFGKDAPVYPKNSIPGKAITAIEALREEGAARNERAAPEKLVLFPNGASAAYIAQAHESLYGSAPKNTAQQQNARQARTTAAPR